MKKLLQISTILYVTLISCKQEPKQLLIHSEKEESNEHKNETLQIIEIDSSQFPKSLQYEGFVKNAVRWKDKSGDNIAITTETGIHRNEKFKHEYDESGDAELFGYHFLVKNNQVVQTWKVYDYITDCPVDIGASFVKNTFNVTDLDKNGIAEIWLMYKTVCHGDVSPSNMKIIMYEGKQKYAMRGENKVQIGVDDNGKETFEGGKYIFDTVFEKGPKVFKDYALNLWNKNVFEKWGD
ncbi:M949_RS01915 family surface polysaccharide biosynthesis protein [Flavobacterium sp. H122]|uniref:M949_RS01915 family surface polysaccharide biosynthesis protein n=1 Tax=Flavobacterium sp. H122 TaxID=2529860 RepID=UPI0010A9CADC|nr:hypothetical protein [Flavobacterium sp. H122]